MLLNAHSNMLLVPNRSNSGPNWAVSGRIWQNPHLCWSALFRDCTNTARSWPSFVPMWSMSMSSIWPNLAKFGPTLADVGASFADSWPNLAEIGPHRPNLIGVDPTLAKVGHFWMRPKPGQIWPASADYGVFGPTRPECGNNWPAFREFGRPPFRNIIISSSSSSLSLSSSHVFDLCLSLRMRQHVLRT